MINDGIHPNKVGHQNIAETFVKHMSEYNKQMLWKALPWYRKLWYTFKKRLK